jgi:predicted DNA binding CopG/RHH family protein
MQLKTFKEAEAKLWNEIIDHSVNDSLFHFERAYLDFQARIDIFINKQGLFT